MSKIKSLDTRGSIVFAYTVEPTLIQSLLDYPVGATRPMFLTEVRVQTYFDGDVNIDLLGVPQTSTGRPHKGRNAEYVYLDEETRAKVLGSLGIDASAMPVIRALATGPQYDED